MQWKTYGGRRFHLHPTGYWISSKPKPQISLHRFVWQEAHGPIPDGYHIHHRDHDRGNNALENLELVYGPAHNSYHGRVKEPLRGEQCGAAKLTAEQVLEIRSLYRKSCPGLVQSLADRYGITRWSVHATAMGRRWAHLPGELPPAQAAQCRRGHDYTPENTCYTRSGARYCRECHRVGQKAAAARRNAKLKQERLEARQARQAERALRASPQT